MTQKLTWRTLAAVGVALTAAVTAATVLPDLITRWSAAQTDGRGLGHASRATSVGANADANANANPNANAPANASAAALAGATLAARDARTQCFPLIHHDTLLFEDCVLDLARRAGTAPLQQLGVVYFGWVGAMNSARMGMQGSAETAARFLAQLTPLQKQLHIEDLPLCETVAGDCVTRVAQLGNQRLRREVPPPRPEAAGHLH